MLSFKVKKDRDVFISHGSPIKANDLFADAVISCLSLGSMHFGEPITQLSCFQTQMKFHLLLFIVILY